MTIDLSGDWEGHYEQGGGRHGISMHVVQRGQSFVGRMRDADTLMAGREVLHSLPADGSAKPEVVGEAEVLSMLPEHSTVEGEIEGRVVAFIKSYQGTSSTNVWVPGRAKMKFESPGHQVHYRGNVGAQGSELHGHWTIPTSLGGPKLRGRFLLRRVPKPAPPATPASPS